MSCASGVRLHNVVVVVLQLIQTEPSYFICGLLTVDCSFLFGSSDFNFLDATAALAGKDFFFRIVTIFSLSPILYLGFSTYILSSDSWSGITLFVTLIGVSSNKAGGGGVGGDKGRGTIGSDTFPMVPGDLHKKHKARVPFSESANNLTWHSCPTLFDRNFSSSQRS